MCSSSIGVPDVVLRYCTFHYLWSGLFLVVLLIENSLALAQDSVCPKCKKLVPLSATMGGEEYCPDCRHYFLDQSNNVRSDLITIVKHASQVVAPTSSFRNDYKELTEQLEQYGAVDFELRQIDGYFSIDGVRKASRTAFREITVGEVRPLLSVSETDVLSRLLIPLLAVSGVPTKMYRLIFSQVVWFSRIWEAKKNPDDPFTERDYSSFIWMVLGLYLDTFSLPAFGTTQSQIVILQTLKMYFFEKCNFLVFPSNQNEDPIGDGITYDTFRCMREDLSKSFTNAQEVDLTITDFNTVVQAGFQDSEEIEEHFFNIVRQRSAAEMRNEPFYEKELCAVIRYKKDDTYHYHIFLAFSLVIITVPADKLVLISEQLAAALDRRAQLFSENRSVQDLITRGLPATVYLKCIAFTSSVLLMGYQGWGFLRSGYYSWQIIMANFGVFAIWIALMRYNS